MHRAFYVVTVVCHSILTYFTESVVFNFVVAMLWYLVYLKDLSALLYLSTVYWQINFPCYIGNKFHIWLTVIGELLVIVCGILIVIGSISGKWFISVSATRRSRYFMINSKDNFENFLLVFMFPNKVPQ